MCINSARQLVSLALLLASLSCSPTGDGDNAQGQTAMSPTEQHAGEIVGLVLAPSNIASTKSDLRPVAGAVVYVADSSNEKPRVPDEPVVLKVSKDGVIPSHSVIVVGQKLIIEPLDDDSYNLHVESPSEPKVGAVKPASNRLEVVFTKPTDAAFIGCSIHPSIQGYVTVVATNAFVRSNEDGTFTLPQRFPPGQYVVHAFHPRFGRAAIATTLAHDVKPAEVELILPGQR